jgi:hypothetical protein
MRALAILLAGLAATPLWAAPADIITSPAPTLGADPPKAKELRDGDVSVSTQTGALTYSYPIAVPPGRLGMQPSLALAYSSQAPIYGGIAAGWSLSIPEIRRDTSFSWLRQRWSRGPASERERYVSSLAGERPLVAVSEPTGKAADVATTYRAQNDTAFDRYERLHDGAGARWRVRSHGGVTHTFGDVNLALGANGAPEANDAWSPLTRSVDAYGNTVEYEWRGTRIHEIRYTSNPAVTPARPAFARVEFLWSPAPVCSPGTAVGQVDDRRLGIVRGGWRLNLIRATAHAPGEPNAPQHTREIALGYDLAASACDALHGPILQLRTIQESAWGDSEPAVTLPPITFGYNRRARTFDQAVAESMSDPTSPGGRGNLGWGTRDGEWPTVESMFLDFDGDGLQDRLFMVDRDQCTFAWKKNRGADAAGHFTFDPPSAPIALPRLPWQTGTRGASEWCSLSGQHTAYVNTTIATLPNCTQASTFLAYRWMDPDGDGRTDLVTAIHARGAFDANAEPLFGAWPACGAGDVAACRVPEASCAAAAVTCPFGQGAGKCRFDEEVLAACNESIPRASCDLVTAWASQAPTSTCVDGCKGERGCTTEPACVADCERRCSNGSTFKQAYPSVSPYCSHAPPSPRIGVDLTQCLSLATTPEPTGASCPAETRPQRRCGRYPWMIYDHSGGGLASTPRILYQPVPLESDTGDSSFGATVGATNHGILDLDGDGVLDAIVRGRTYQDSENQAQFASPFWGVFPGDGAGGFVTSAYSVPDAQDVPAMAYWLVPDDAPVSASESRAPHEYDAAAIDDLDNVGVSTVVDLTGDGAPDYVWKTSSSEFGPRLRPPRNREPSDSATLRLFAGDGGGFEFDRTSLTDATPLSKALPSVSYLSRSFVDVSAWAGSAGPAEAVRSSRARLVDLDGDGRPDVLHAARLNPPSEAPAQWAPAALYINGGGAFLPTQAMPSGWHERMKQESVTYQDNPLDGHATGLFWQTTRDLVDLDGDGLLEAWDSESGTYHRDSDRQPLRLLASVDNGRGGIVSVTYAASTDATAVTQDAATRRAMPHTQWVVASMTSTDAWDAGDTATTAYRYAYPAWKPDDEGRWGFRGFEQVTTTLPSGARQVAVYGFDVDWSGRLKGNQGNEKGQSRACEVGSGPRVPERGSPPQRSKGRRGEQEVKSGQGTKAQEPPRDQTWRQAGPTLHQGTQEDIPWQEAVERHH